MTTKQKASWAERKLRQPVIRDRHGRAVTVCRDYEIEAIGGRSDLSWVAFVVGGDKPGGSASAGTKESALAKLRECYPLLFVHRVRRTAARTQPVSESPPAGDVVAYHSCAQWPAGLLNFAYEGHDNTTRDRHTTKEQADGVCRLLRRNGLGGERVHFPVRVWSEPIYAQDAARA